MHPSSTQTPPTAPPIQAPSPAGTNPAGNRPLSHARLERAERALAHLPARQFRRAIGQALEELSTEWGIEL